MSLFKRFENGGLYFNKPLASVFAVFLLTCPIAAVSQQSPSSSTTFQLDKISFSPLSRYTQEQIITASGLQIGQHITPDALDAAVDRLINMGLFNKVSYQYRILDGKGEVSFRVEEVKWGVPVIFDNFIWFTDEELVNAVSQEAPSFDNTAPDSGPVLDGISRALDRLLKARGIVAQVEYIPSFETGGRNKKHIYRANSSSLSLCSLHFPGASAISEKDLIKKSALLFKEIYSRSLFMEFFNANLIPFYREHGHLRVKLLDPQAKPGTDAVCKQRVIVTVPVEEGPAYQWDAARLIGHSALSQQTITSLLGMKVGEAANGSKIDAGMKSLRAAYGEKGYITVKLIFEPGFDDINSRVSYKISIAEGPQYRMGKIRITGLPEKEANKLEKKWKLKEGEVYDATYLGEFMKEVITKIKEVRSGSQEVGVSVKPNQQDVTVDVTISLR